MNFTITVFAMSGDIERTIATVKTMADTVDHAFEMAREFSDFATMYAEILTVGIEDRDIWVEVAP